MWVLFASLASISGSIRAILSKQVVDKTNGIAASWGLFAITTVLAGCYALISGITIANQTFYMWLGIRIVIDCIATWTFFQALAAEEVSFVMPLTALLPVLTIGTSFFINQQLPSLQSLAGIMLIVVGVVVLFLKKTDFKNFKANSTVIKSTIFMLITVTIWSFAEAIHKQAISVSSPATYFFLSYTGFLLAFTVLAWAKDREQLKRLIFERPLNIQNFWQGVTMTSDQIFSLNAVVTGPVAFVTAIKSASIVFSSLGAVVFLKEKITRQEIIGILICFSGLLLTIF